MVMRFLGAYVAARSYVYSRVYFCVLLYLLSRLAQSSWWRLVALLTSLRR